MTVHKALIPALLLSIISVAATADPRVRQWKLPDDVFASRNQISFNQGARDVWFFMKSASRSRNDANYSLLPVYQTPLFGGSFNWGAPWPAWTASAQRHAEYPFFALNVNYRPIKYCDDSCVFYVPARSIALHPAANGAPAIVAWRSPVNG